MDHVATWQVIEKSSLESQSPELIEAPSLYIARTGGYSRPHDILCWPSHRHGNIGSMIGVSPREARMLAEIFLLRLEATARAAKEAATITRSTSPFVPVTLPVPTPKAA